MKNPLGIYLIVLLLVGCAHYLWRTYPYTTDSRTSHVVNLSEQGCVFKTMEGQMNLSKIDNGMLEIREFSLRYKSIYHELEQMEGNKLRLEYEKVNDSFLWMGDSDSFITG